MTNWWPLHLFVSSGTNRLPPICAKSAFGQKRTFSQLRARSGLPAKAMPAHPADDDGIKMVERPKKAVDEPDAVQARVHVDAETYWIAFLIASIRSFARNGFCRNAMGSKADAWILIAASSRPLMKIIGHFRPSAHN